MSRGLSASDTPGLGSQEFLHPKGWQSTPSGLASLQDAWIR
jgi:hypothetical protein